MHRVARCILPNPSVRSSPSGAVGCLMAIAVFGLDRGHHRSDGIDVTCAVCKSIRLCSQLLQNAHEQIGQWFVFM